MRKLLIIMFLAAAIFLWIALSPAGSETQRGPRKLTPAEQKDSLDPKKRLGKG